MVSKHLGLVWKDKLVSQVTPGSLAERYNVLGWTILSIDGEIMHNASDINNAIKKAKQSKETIDFVFLEE